MIDNINKLLRLSTVIIVMLLLISRNGFANDEVVSTSNELIKAINHAKPGDEITLLPGVYRLQRLNTRLSGTDTMPIVVKAQIPGEAIIEGNSEEVISIRHGYWVFQGLVVKGGAEADHAFHIAGKADHVVLRDNKLIDFNAHIKVNAENGNYPRYGEIIDNDIYNNFTRNTDKPVTTIDIVAADDWLVAGNYIADFAKGAGDKTSYGLFIKGNSSRGLVERNLIICAKNVPSETSVGLSFGGGGTGTPYCVNQDCTREHSGGIMRNNIVLNCSDVGIYLNKSWQTVVENNTLLMTAGIDVRFSQSSALIRRNILSGSIRTRDGGQMEEVDNIKLGSQTGMWLPALARKLKYRISDYDAKFPNWISRQNVENGSRLIDKLTFMLAKTRWGLGLGKTEECFPGLFVLDISPAEGCQSALLLGINTSVISGGYDFWGRKRPAQLSSIGAIDFYNSPCDLNYRLQHKNTALADKCKKSL